MTEPDPGFANMVEGFVGWPTVKECWEESGRHEVTVLGMRHEDQPEAFQHHQLMAALWAIAGAVAGMRDEFKELRESREK